MNRYLSYVAILFALITVILLWFAIRVGGVFTFIANFSALITLLTVILPEINSQYQQREEDNQCPFCKSIRRKYTNMLGMEEYLCPYCDCDELEMIQERES